MILSKKGGEWPLDKDHTLGEDNEVTNTGELELRDVGAAPKWRNLRIALDEIPEEANVVRLVAVDDSTDEDSWLAFTPPRVPELTSLNSRLLDSSMPGLLDWSTAFRFCPMPAHL